MADNVIPFPTRGPLPAPDWAAIDAALAEMGLPPEEWPLPPA